MVLDAVGTEVVVVAHGGQRGVGEVADILITVLTPAEAQLGVAEPVMGGLHKLLVHDVPSEREGREGAVEVVGTEAAGAVAAYCELCHVALVVVVAQTGEERGQAMLGVGTAPGVEMRRGARDLAVGIGAVDHLAVAVGIVDGRLVDIDKVPGTATELTAFKLAG